MGAGSSPVRGGDQRRARLKRTPPPPPSRANILTGFASPPCTRGLCCAVLCCAVDTRNQTSRACYHKILYPTVSVSRRRIKGPVSHELHAYLDIILIVVCFFCEGPTNARPDDQYPVRTNALFGVVHYNSKPMVFLIYYGRARLTSFLQPDRPVTFDIATLKKRLQNPTTATNQASASWRKSGPRARCS